MNYSNVHVEQIKHSGRSYRCVYRVQVCVCGIVGRLVCLVRFQRCVTDHSVETELSIHTAPTLMILRTAHLIRERENQGVSS